MYAFKYLQGLILVTLAVTLQVAAGIPPSIYDRLVLYTKHSAAAYGLSCPKPVGSTLVKQINNFGTGTNGYVSRDRKHCQVIVAFRGTSEPLDALTDIRIELVPFNAPGITHPARVKVHSGFLEAWNSVASDVLSAINSQSNICPRGYTIVVTGHSLGGAVASIAAVSIKGAHPHVPIRLYTFGQPRVGNLAFARYVEHRIGSANIYRAVHTLDGVPGLPPPRLGYSHFANEYWNYIDPPSAANTRKCRGGEDPTCSASIPSTGINPPHLYYFGRVMTYDLSLCF